MFNDLRRGRADGTTGRSPCSAPGEVEGRLEGRAREGEDPGEVLVAKSARRLGAAQDVHELALPLELQRQLADPPVFEQLPEDRVVRADQPRYEGHRVVASDDRGEPKRQLEGRSEERRVGK